MGLSLSQPVQPDNTVDRPPKKIILCFDGTSKDPSKGLQAINDEGEKKDSSITNVLKIHLLAGGSLDNKETNVEGQHSLYYSGVGTRGSGLLSVLRRTFGLNAMRNIKSEARMDLEMLYRPGDSLYIFGFSRGAAIARMFACELYKEGIKVASGETVNNPPIEFIGAYDTVLSAGLPEDKVETLPASTDVFEEKRLCDNVRRAVHCVSIDETRVHFQPIMMNQEPKVTEVWFAGNHTDVGGGFYKDGLSDISLEYMMAQAAGPKKDGLGFLKVSEVPDTALISPTDNKNTIQRDDDLAFNPDATDVQHDKSESFPHSLFESAPRAIYVAKDDKPIKDGVVILHESVVERLKKVPEYRNTAVNLKDLKYKLTGNDLMITDNEVVGFEAHM